MKDAFSVPFSSTVFFEQRFKDTDLFEKKHTSVSSNTCFILQTEPSFDKRAFLSASRIGQSLV
jgi:hypothetical protein